MKVLRIAIGSTLSHPGDLKKNLAQINDFARHAAYEGADLLLTPEMSTTGYGSYPEILALAEPAGQGPVYDGLASIAWLHETVVAAGFVEANPDGRRHIAHYLVYPNGDFLVQRKYRVTGVEEPLDSAAPVGTEVWSDTCELAKPKNFSLFELRGVRCACTICADIGIPGLNPLMEKLDVRLLLCPVGAGGSKEKCVSKAELATREGREKYLKYLEQVFFPGNGIVECIEYKRALAAVNQCGWDGRSHAHVGHGMVISPLGEVPAFFHGLPLLERQRPLFAVGDVDVEDLAG